MSKSWNALVDEAFYSTITHLDLGQFWASIGTSDVDISYFVKLVSRCHHVKKLSLAFCTHLSDQSFFTIFQALPQQKARVTSLNLFYCYNLTRSGIKHVVEFFPVLEELNLGRCMKISNESFMLLQQLGELKHLSLVNFSFIHSFELSPNPCLQTCFAHHLCVGIGVGSVQIAGSTKRAYVY